MVVGAMITSPKVQAQVAEYFGEAPANLNACAETTDKSFCTTYHASDQAYYLQLAFRQVAARSSTWRGSISEGAQQSPSPVL